MNIARILQAQARELGDRPAIIEHGGIVSFADLDRAAGSAAAELFAAGLRPGMRAVVFSPMSIALYAAIIGMFRLRVTAVFVDPSAGRSHLESCLIRVRPDAFVAIPRAHLLRLTSAAVRSIPIKLTIGGALPGVPMVGRQVSDVTPDLQSVEPQMPAIVTFTSGSTGEPRAVVRTHGFLVAQHRALVESLGLAPGDVDLTTLPVFLLANLASGVTSVIPDADLRAPGAIARRPVLKQIRATQPTRTVASPAFLDRLGTKGTGTFKGARRLARTFKGASPLCSLRHVFTGGAPVFPAMLDRIAALAPDASVVAVYGSTEAEPIAKIDRREIAAADRLAMAQGAGLLAGTPSPSVELRIIADRWGTPLGPWRQSELDHETRRYGLAGEIVVSGEHVLTSYLDGQGDEETKIKVDGRIWHRTGDAGYLDGQRRLWLLGRSAAKVCDAGGVLYPFAVECAASGIPGVRRSAFVLHHNRRLLVVEADRSPGFVKPSAREATLREALMSRLAWARLVEIVMVRRIPVDRRHNAKIDYPALTRMLAPA
jgi:acyl-CoA synthetase (AMP-forming)/AMP-acid ligase II